MTETEQAGSLTSQFTWTKAAEALRSQSTASTNGMATALGVTEAQGLHDHEVRAFIPQPAAFAALVKILNALSHYWFGSVELPPPKGNPYECCAASQSAARRG